MAIGILTEAIGQREEYNVNFNSFIDIMFCKHCGKEIDEDSAFCQYCGMSQSVIETVTESDVEVENTIEIESVVEKESVTDICENVEEESKIATVNGKFWQKDNQESSDLSFSDYWLRKVGLICAIVFFAFTLFGILTAIKQVSKEWLGNSALYWTTIVFLIIAVIFYIVRCLRRKKFKVYFEPVAFIFVIIVIVIISIVGRVITTNKESKPTIENTVDLDALRLKQDNEKLKASILKANLSLPLIIDEYTSWTNIRLDKDVVICTYRIDDAKFDLYEIDVVEYKENITANMESLFDKQLLQLCASTNKMVNYRIVSQWEPSRSIEITFGNLEVGEIANK